MDSGFLDVKNYILQIENTGFSTNNMSPVLIENTGFSTNETLMNSPTLCWPFKIHVISGNQ